MMNEVLHAKSIFNVINAGTGHAEENEEVLAINRLAGIRIWQRSEEYSDAKEDSYLYLHPRNGGYIVAVAILAVDTHEEAVYDLELCVLSIHMSNKNIEKMYTAPCAFRENVSSLKPVGTHRLIAGFSAFLPIILFTI